MIFLRRILTILLLLLPVQARAGGWLQELGDMFAQITYGATSANTVYRFDGETRFPTDNPPFTVRDYPLAERSLSLYIEYGLLPDLTLIGSGVLKRVVITSPVERKRTQGFGDIGVAAKYKLAEFDQQVVSTTLGVTFPTGYTRDLTPPLGAGNVNVELLGNYGISLYPLPAYATASLGYRLRTGIFPSGLRDDSRPYEPNYADEVVGEVELGYTIADRVLLKGVVRGLFSTRLDDDDFDVEHPPETQRYIKAGGGMFVSVINGFNLTAEVYGTPYGRKATNSVDVYLGVAWKGGL